MVKLEVVQGKKGPNDKLVLLTANREPLTIEHLLTILSIWFESEDSVYPPSEGYEGRAFLMKAIVDVFAGRKLETVLQRYRLKPSKNGFSFTVKTEGGDLNV